MPERLAADNISAPTPTSGPAGAAEDAESHDSAGAAIGVWDVLPGLLFLVSLLLFAYRLGSPPVYMYDEVYHAYTAGEYVRGNRDAYVWSTRSPRQGVAYMWNHPPAGVHMISLGIRLWGDTPFGWRFASAVFGAAGIALVFALARELTGDRWAALLAAGLVMVDGLYYVQSRMGMLDMFGVVFMIGAFLALFRYLNRPLERSVGSLLTVGLFIGLAVATKWNAAYAAALIALIVTARTAAVFVAARGSRARLARHDPNVAGRAGGTPTRHLIAVPIALVVVPALVYLAAYVPFFATGHTFDQFIELQRQIYAYHTGLKATHTYQSSWWQWPLALRPVWYYVAYSKEAISNVYANVNPLLAWAFLPAMVWLVARWWRERPAALVVMLVGFFGQWLPWALVPRIAFVYHFLPSVPFGCIAVAVAAVTAIRVGGAPRILTVGCLVAIVAAFMFFLPIYSAIPLSRPAFGARMWLGSWR